MHNLVMDLTNTVTNVKSDWAQDRGGRGALVNIALNLRVP